MTTGNGEHPADRLIHELIVSARSATDAEIQIITERIATAPFNPDVQRVQRNERGQTYHAITLGAQSDSLTLHLFRRVVGGNQWAVGTSAEDYLRSLQRAALAPHNRVVLYRQWQDRNLAAVIAPTANILTTEQLGPRWEPNLLVLYLADRGILISGYQFSAMNTIRNPGDALWLR